MIEFIKENKKIVILIALVTAIISAFVGATTAYLIAISGSVENTFTIGYINLELNETTGNSYQMIPGKVIPKDPTVKVVNGSEDCWLFIKVTESAGFDDYFTYQIHEDWTHLGGYEGVYYRQVVNVKTDLNFEILKNNSITVKENLTEEKMSAIQGAPTISFKAYAAQMDVDNTAQGAWSIILGEGE